ncbi:MAG: dienelactone hydrolase family protein [Candidatus Eremiobacteraeota bacterium]|nr:dienelactone hydrolase family protein [Candidatus Eremiobacteraeota bacterium]MBV9264199.1 dienelactone hydrolase family protein [Candidatus Eremiobacteraeota bacterium]
MFRTGVERSARRDSKLNHARPAFCHGSRRIPRERLRGRRHAFCDDSRSAYDPAAAEDSWRRSIAFLKSAM